MTTLGELGELRTGYLLRTAARHAEGGTHSLVQLGNLGEHGIQTAGLIRVDLERVRERDLLKPGDVLFRGRGANYRCVVAGDLPPGAVAAAPLHVLTVTRAGILPDYVAWYVNQPLCQAALAAEARGTHVPSVSREAFARLEVPIPPLAEQHRVVEINRLLREERRLCEELARRRERLASEELLRRIRRLDGRTG